METMPNSPASPHGIRCYDHQVSNEYCSYKRHAEEQLQQLQQERDMLQLALINDDGVGSGNLTHKDQQVRQDTTRQRNNSVITADEDRCTVVVLYDWCEALLHRLQMLLANRVVLVVMHHWLIRHNIEQGSKGYCHLASMLCWCRTSSRRMISCGYSWQR